MTLVHLGTLAVRLDRRGWTVTDRTTGKTCTDHSLDRALRGAKGN